MDSRTPQVPDAETSTVDDAAETRTVPDPADEDGLRRSGLARLSSKVKRGLWSIVRDEADEAAAQAALRSTAGVWLFRAFVAALLVGLVLAAAGVI